MAGAARQATQLSRLTGDRQLALSASKDQPSVWVPKTQFPCKSAHSQTALRVLGTRDVWAAAD
jgi:hypothetical protein